MKVKLQLYVIDTWKYIHSESAAFRMLDSPDVAYAQQINPDVISVEKEAPTPFTRSVGAQYNVDRDTDYRCNSNRYRPAHI